MDADPVIHEALRCYPGLRVIRQDPWECAASFMLSAFNNIPRLTQMIEQLSCRFAPPVSGFVRARSGRLEGTPERKTPPGPQSSLTHLPGGAYSAQLIRAGSNPFPRPEALAGASERTLRNCGLGYRAPYLKATAEKVASGQVDLEKLRGMEDEELR